MIKGRTIELPAPKGIEPLTPQPKQTGFRQRAKTFPKFGISGKQAQQAMCLADGQPLAAHSKKNLERHFIWIQNNYINSEKNSSDLRSDITRYEKKFGKLKPEKKVNKDKPKKKVE